MCIAIRSVDMNKMEKVLLAAPFRKLTRLTHVVIAVNLSLCQYYGSHLRVI